MSSNLPAIKPKERVIAALTNERILSALKAVATKHLTADRVVRLVIGEFTRNPKLAECTQSSIILCALAFSQLGLEPGAFLGHAYMIPRNNRKTGKLEANFQLGYKGKLALNYRSGMFEFIYGDVVYGDDRFEYEYGSEAILRHVPNHESEHHRPDDVVAAYAIAHLKGSTRPIFRVLSRQKIDSIRAQSQTPNDGPWVTHFAEMACKTAVLALERFLPMSTEVATGMVLETKAEVGELSFADFGSAELIEQPKDHNGGSEGLKERLMGSQEPKGESVEPVEPTPTSSMSA